MGCTKVHQVAASLSPQTIFTNAHALTTFILILLATCLAETTTYSKHRTLFLQVVMLPCELPTVLPTKFALDLQQQPFCVKQGTPTQQSDQLTVGLYRLRKSIPKITLVVNPSDTYKSAYIVTLRYASPPN